MKKISSNIGTIIVWTDFVRNKKTNNGGFTYVQSNTKLDGYSQRYIGIHISQNFNISHSNTLYVATAISKKEDNTRWWRFILENRISTIMKNNNNIGPEDKGMTVVPMAYKSLLFDDAYTYTNLYGLIDPTMLDMAIKMALLDSKERIDRYDARLRADDRAGRQEIPGV